MGPGGHNLFPGKAADTEGMKKLALGLPTLILLAVYFSGCAAILAKKQEPVSFASNPDGADIYVNGAKMGKTPLQINLDPKQNYTVEFRKGTETKTVLVNHSVAGGWIVLDILFGLVPIIVDAATNSWYTLDSNEARVAF